MNDLYIYESKDGGELCLSNGDLHKIRGLVNQVYLALFGGSEEVTSENLQLQEQRFDYWGNALIQDENQQFNSTFEQALKENSLSIQGINNLDQKIKQDLKFLRNFAEIKEPEQVENKIKFIWDGTKQDLEVETDCLVDLDDILEGIDYDEIDSTLIVY